MLQYGALILSFALSLLASPYVSCRDEEAVKRMDGMECLLSQPDGDSHIWE